MPTIAPMPTLGEPAPAGDDQPGEAPTDETRTPAAGQNELRRGGRVEFDSRLVQGQTAQSGAIYLFARRPSDLRSMIPERESYRSEILSSVYSKQAR